MPQPPTAVATVAPETEPQQRPFLIENHRRDVKPGHFVPEARICITAALRTGGLLNQLQDAEARVLLAVLTLLNSEGRIRATAWQVAEALQVSESTAKERLDRLAAPAPSRPQPVLIKVPRESGMDAYALSPMFVTSEEAPQERSAPSSLRSFTPAGRAAVIAHSRALYTRPRAEVEKIVLAQMGHASDVDEDTPEGRAVARLMRFGVTKETAEELVAEYPLEEITNQMDWMGYRSVRSPEGYLVAAIRNRYNPPLGALLSQRTEETSTGDSSLIPEAVGDEHNIKVEGGTDA